MSGTSIIAQIFVPLITSKQILHMSNILFVSVLIHLDSIYFLFSVNQINFKSMPLTEASKH